MGFLKPNSGFDKAHNFDHSYMSCRVLFFCFFLAIVLKATSQSVYKPGYIVTIEQDTVSGSIVDQALGKRYVSCSFVAQDSITKFLPDELLGYGYHGGRVYRSSKIDSSFVEVVFQGPLSVYRLENQFYVEKDTSFLPLVIEKTKVVNDGREVLKTSHHWKGVLAYLISDCLKEGNIEVSEMRLNERNLISISEKYSQCREEDYQVFKESIPIVTIQLGAAVGFSRYGVNIDGRNMVPTMDDKYSSFDPSIGLVGAFTFNRFNDRFGFQVETHYQKVEYTSYIRFKEGHVEHHDSYIMHQTISLPVSMKYTVPRKKHALYLQAGVNLDFHIATQAKSSSEFELNNIISTQPEIEPFEVNKNQIGVFGGAGIQLPFKGRITDVSLRYMNMRAFNETDFIYASNSRISFNFILFLK
ncbi:outer membrane beta-barrel protein [Marinoscillum furvescens]|uniref:Outer membrane protein with beta-barrel domain n=1 Tax=Marinoscillum furvescens DSM 4134 TaxID=1122208 RepID=A0A3D9L570_MARFU|nr:outer membrane beta-barrel protein [Marinoscillum furvescens]REE01173.1 outer membrane protein with beta-barrel domain [Marinoscillum furvescens DSM 4134]